MAKDSSDKVTLDLLEVKRPVGRPLKEGALSNSERQAAYRQRQRLSQPASDPDAEYRLQCFTQAYGAEIERLHSELNRLRHALEQAETGWPEVLQKSCKAHLQEEIWRLKHAQLVRIIRSAGLDLPEGH